jgi:acetolactate synthase-1/2/3 large subunit
VAFKPDHRGGIVNINEFIVQTLESIGVDYVFGGSGQVNASLMIALKNSNIKTAIVKNEQAASFMACGYSMFSDKLGVCFATGGPGAFNLMSGLGVALSDSLPVLAISGYEAANLLGKGALAETSGLNRTPDSQKMFAATTKKTFLISDPDQTCDVVEEAINTAFEGRPGPVHIHIPIDLTTKEVTNYREIKIDVKPVLPKPEKIVEFAEAIARAIRDQKQIMALLGYGCVRSGAEKELLAFVEKFQIPFATTMDAKGILPEDHPLSLGVFGTAGDPGANKYFKDAEFVIAMGNSFAHNATFRFKGDLYDGKLLMHINIDRHEINKVYEADYGMVSDVKPAIAGIIEELSKRVPVVERKEIEGEKWHDIPINHSGTKIHPAEMVKVLSDNLPPDSIVMGDAGGHMLWLNCYLKLSKGQIYQNPGSFGPMASHVNGSLGVKCAHPDRTVISACGDGGYLMGGFELLTAVQYNIPVIWVIFNNGEFNIIKDFLLQQFGQAPFMSFMNPDYVAYARACGAEGYRVEKLDEFEGVFRKALQSDKPTLIDVALESEVYPPFHGSGI